MTYDTVSDGLYLTDLVVKLHNEKQTKQYETKQKAKEKQTNK